MEIGVIVIGEIVRERGNENERGNEIEIGREMVKMIKMRNQREYLMLTEISKRKPSR